LWPGTVWGKGGVERCPEEGREVDGALEEGLGVAARH